MTNLNADAEEQAKVFAALSDPMRLRFIQALREATELSGTEIADKLSISLALVCHHSRVLREAGLVLKRKDGQTAFYKLDKKALTTAVRGVMG